VEGDSAEEVYREFLAGGAEGGVWVSCILLGDVTFEEPLIGPVSSLPSSSTDKYSRTTNPSFLGTSSTLGAGGARLGSSP
jgi:hypothetical protein